MSNLLKKALDNSKGKNKEEEDYSDELKDQVPDLDQIDQPYIPEQGMEKYSPLDYKKYLNILYYHNNSPIYYSKGKNEDLILFCVHGAGLSGTSFSLLAEEVKGFASLVSFDMISHGNNKNFPESPDFSIGNLVREAEGVLESVLDRFKNSVVVLIGHSLGGAIVPRLAQSENEKFQRRIHGMVMIDVVEGTSKNALPYMKNIVLSRPKYFPNLEKAVQYMIISGSIINLKSAKISTPPLFEKIGNKYYWKCNLLLTEKYWLKWFDHLNEYFLTTKIPKILLLAAPDRMDKELTICHMQGKFKLVCVKTKVGHHVHEDAPKETRDVIYQFLKKFKIPLNMEQVREKEEIGLGKFDNKLE